MGGQRHAPVNLPPGKTRYPLHRRLGGPQGRSGRLWKISPPPGFDPRAFQPITSRYTYYAVPDCETLVYYLLTYLLTSWCRVILEKLTGLQLVKKFPAFYGIRRFITALTSVRHLSLSWASPIQSTYPHPTSWRSILILSTHLRKVSPVVSSPPVSPPRPYMSPLLTHTRHMPSPSHSSRFYHPHNIG